MSKVTQLSQVPETVHFAILKTDRIAIPGYGRGSTDYVDVISYEPCADEEALKARITSLQYSGIQFKVIQSHPVEIQTQIIVNVIPPQPIQRGGPGTVC